MNWAQHKSTWPHAQHSRFVNVRPHRWHVQDMGSGSVILLLHGAGASGHSYRNVMPILARTHRVISVDLPGHGFTLLGRRSRAGLDHVAQDLRALLRHLDIRPDVIVGHSAGAAVAARVALDTTHPPKLIVCINGAFEMFDGLAGWLFPAMARLLSLNPLTSLLVAKTAGNQTRVEHLLKSTGSILDAEGVRLYHALISDKAHIDGTLAMMSQWRLEKLMRDMPALPCPALFLVGGKDGTVPPRVSEDAAKALTGCTVIRMENAGHLLHEEHPQTVATAILKHLAETKKGSQANA